MTKHVKRRDLIKGGAVATAAAGASTLAAPVFAQGKIEINMVSTWPRDFPGLGVGAQRLAKRIGEMSDGRITVKYFAAGERVGAFDSFDEVASGKAQAYHAADYYWKGKHPGWAFYTTVPFGMTNQEHQAWLNHMGGQELWDELAAEFGLKCLAAGGVSVQMGGWFKKEMESPEDLKGLKMRIPGLAGDVMTKLGASPVSLPGGQIYENLVSGAIEATEWVGPYNDYFMKFYEATKYYYYPGFHEPGAALSMGLNKKFWDGLTEADQSLLRAAASTEIDEGISEYFAKNGEYLQKLVDEHGVELREFNDEMFDAFGAASAEVFAEVREHSDLAKRIHDSYVAARETTGGWSKLADAAYLAQRNRVLDV